MSGLVSKFTNSHLSLMCFIKNVKVTPDSLGTNIPFQLTATVFNFGTVAIDKHYGKIYTGFNNTINFQRYHSIYSKFSPDTGQTFTWNMVPSSLTQSMGYYTISAKSRVANYTTQGIFNINFTPQTQFNVNGKLYYDNTPATRPLAKVQLNLKTTEGNPVANTQTDSTGAYNFSKVNIGKYFIEQLQLLYHRVAIILLMPYS